MPKKVAIFDMDGLFVDSERVYAEGWHYGFKHFGITPPEGFVESFTGHSAKSNDAKVAELLNDVDFAKKIRAVREEYYQIKLHNGEIKLKKFAKEIAEKLKEKGLKVVLASSSTRARIDELLSQNGASHLFDAIVCADHVQKVKPDPEIYLVALASVGAKAEDAIAFEDTFIGATAAVRAGIDVCLVSEQLYQEQSNFEHEQCQGLFNDLEEAYNYLEANQVC